MVEGEPSSSRYIATHAKVEDSANRLKIKNSTTYCRIEGITEQGAVGKHVGEDVGNQNTAFEGIDDIDVGSMEFESTEEAESFYMMYARAIDFGVRKSSESVSFMRSHRKVGKSDLQEAVVMQQAGIRTSHIMRLLAVQARGYHNLGFHVTVMYNALNRQRQLAVGHGDSDSAIAFLSVFDSTYNTNQYKFSLVVLCGVNNYYSICIFVCALIVREGDERYDWVISTFLETMHGRKPLTVVTDGDKSMRKCIKNLILTAKHRLCSFHLEMNTATNVREKEFLEAFKTCMFMNCTVDKFETMWAEVVRRFGIEDNEWVNKMYRKREMWAMAFLRGNFFGGVRSTQRCEKKHQVLKLHLTPKLKFFEYLQTYDLVVARLQHEERRQRAVTEYSTLVLATHLHAVKKHVGEVFTRSTFVVVRKEMKKQRLFCRINDTNDGITVVHFMKHLYNYSYYTVAYNKSTGHMKCSCLKIETHGLPCCHMFRTMLFEKLKRISPNCIMKRWTWQAKEGVISNEAAQTTSTHFTEMSRYSTLVSAANDVCRHACKTANGFTNALELFQNESVRAKELQLKRHRGKGCAAVQGSNETVGERNWVKDPEMIASRGLRRGKPRQATISGRESGPNTSSKRRATDNDVHHANSSCTAQSQQSNTGTTSDGRISVPKKQGQQGPIEPVVRRQDMDVAGASGVGQRKKKEWGGPDSVDGFFGYILNSPRPSSYQVDQPPAVLADTFVAASTDIAD
nr:protein FAR1-RELATED SEQUENCE 5-like [Coffea arabica]